MPRFAFFSRRYPRPAAPKAPKATPVPAAELHRLPESRAAGRPGPRPPVLVALDRVSLDPEGRFTLHRGQATAGPRLLVLPAAVTPETLSPHCLSCGGRGYLQFHTPGEPGPPSAHPCLSCGGAATAGTFVVRLATLDADGEDRWGYEFSGSETREFEAAVERARTAAAWIGAMSRCGGLRREVRAVYLGEGDRGRGAVVARVRAG